MDEHNSFAATWTSLHTPAVPVTHQDGPPAGLFNPAAMHNIDCDAPQNLHYQDIRATDTNEMMHHLVSERTGPAVPELQADHPTTMLEANLWELTSRVAALELKYRHCAEKTDRAADLSYKLAWFFKQFAIYYNTWLARYPVLQMAYDTIKQQAERLARDPTLSEQMEAPFVPLRE